MSLVQDKEAAPTAAGTESNTDYFTGGISFAGQPPSGIQVFGRKSYPDWPYMSKSDDIQMVCVFLFNTTDPNRAAKDFIDVSALASSKVGYVCNSDIILDVRYGKTACTFNVTTTPRPAVTPGSVREFGPHDTATRQSVGEELLVMMANALISRGHRCLPEQPPTA